MKPPRAIRTPTLEPVEKYTECCRPWTARPRCRWVNLETNRGARRPKPDHTRRRAKARRLTPPHLLFHAALPLRLSALQLAVRFVMPSATLAVATTATSDAQDLQRFQLGLSNSCLSNSCLSNSALPWSGAALGSSRRCATATGPRTCAHCAPSNRHTGTWWARHAEGSSGGGPTVQDPGAVAAAAAAAAALAAACRRRERSARGAVRGGRPWIRFQGGCCSEPPAAQRCPGAASAGLAPAWRLSTPTPTPAPTPPSAMCVGRPRICISPHRSKKITHAPPTTHTLARTPPRRDARGLNARSHGSRSLSSLSLALRDQDAARRSRGLRVGSDCLRLPPMWLRHTHTH